MKLLQAVIIYAHVVCFIIKSKVAAVIFISKILLLYEKDFCHSLAPYYIAQCMQTT